MDFNELAKEWDNYRRIKRAKIISNEIKNNLLEERNKKALEFGCGTGLISLNLKDYFKEITLIDNSKEMINVANNKIDLLKIDNIKGICCDLINSNISEKCDIIYSSMALHHVVEMNKLIKRFNDLLNEEGKICIVDLNEDDGSFHKGEKDFNGYNGFSQEWFKNILYKNEFKNIKSYTFYKDIKEVDKEKVEYSLFIMIGEK